MTLKSNFFPHNFNINYVDVIYRIVFLNKLQILQLICNILKIQQYTLYKQKLCNTVIEIL
jgi:hypothetical protein